MFGDSALLGSVGRSGQVAAEEVAAAHKVVAADKVAAAHMVAAADKLAGDMVVDTILVEVGRIAGRESAAARTDTAGVMDHIAAVDTVLGS